MQKNIDFIKLIIVGDSSTGKTSILNQYCFNRFDLDVSATIGCDFTQKFVNINGYNLNI